MSEKVVLGAITKLLMPRDELNSTNMEEEFKFDHSAGSIAHMLRTMRHVVSQDGIV